MEATTAKRKKTMTPTAKLTGIDSSTGRLVGHTNFPNSRNRRSSTTEAFRESVKKRINQAALDADSRNVALKYEDTQLVDRRRVNLLLLTRKSDPLGVVWDVRHMFNHFVTP